MQNSEQVSFYFLDELKNLRLFVEISHRHWEEETIKYSESDIETEEATCWDRYQYRNDLSAHFQMIFPQYQKQSYLLMLVSLFEDYLNQLCHRLHFEKDLCCSLKDYGGNGIERAKKYLKKVANVNIPTGTSYWKTIIEARDIRNIVAHNAGHLDKEAHKHHFKIVEQNSKLDSEEFARVHLNIKQLYLMDVITAMENVAKKISENERKIPNKRV